MPTYLKKNRDRVKEGLRKSKVEAYAFEAEDLRLKDLPGGEGRGMTGSG